MGIFDSSSSHVCPLPKNADQITNLTTPITGSLTFQHLILYICSGCLGVVGLTCLLNILMHLSHYSAPSQQRQIIRIVFTPVVFCLFSVCTVANYSTAPYMPPIRDLYELFAMAFIFLLFVEWIAPDPSTRFSYFSTLENRKPQGGRFSKNKSYTIIPGDSLSWFKNKWSIMFLSLVVDIIIIITIAQEASQAAGTYCVTSMKPYFAHLWVLIIGHASIIVGVLAILNLYMRLKPVPEFSSHNSLLKLASLTIIVFTNCIQTLVFSILQGQGTLMGNNKITADDLQYGIPALLVAVEQLVFAGLMLYSFRAAEYKHQGKAMSFPAAIFHALNPLDLIQSIVKGFTHLFSRGSKSQTFSHGSNLRKTYSSGEETTLQPYQYPSSTNNSHPQAQYAAPSQPPQSHSAPQQQDQYVGVIPNYGGQPGNYSVSDATLGYQGGRRSGRRHHGPIGMLVSAGMNAYQSSQGKR